MLWKVTIFCLTSDESVLSYSLLFIIRTSAKHLDFVAYPSPT
jgi:hypothetical protein